MSGGGCVVMPGPDGRAVRASSVLYSASKMPAAPMPVPMHIVTMP